MKTILIIIGGATLASIFWFLSEDGKIFISNAENKNSSLEKKPIIKPTQQDILIVNVDEPINDMPFLFSDNIVQCYDIPYDTVSGAGKVLTAVN